MVTYDAGLISGYSCQSHQVDNKSCLSQEEKHSNIYLNKDAGWERSGSVVVCLTRDRGAASSSLTGFIALCP